MDWADRLNRMLNDRGWSVAELARRSGVSIERLYKYTRGDVASPRGKTLTEIAKALGTSEISLLYGVDEPSNSADDMHIKVGLRSIYVIPMAELVAAGGNVERVDVKAKGRVAAAVDRVGPRAFGLEISDDSMSPAMKPGDVAVVDPDARVEPGRYVAVLIRGSKQIIIRRFRPLTSDLKGSAELVAQNADFPSEKISRKRPGHIIGRVTHIIEKV